MNSTFINTYTVANVGPGFDALTVTWTNLGPLTTTFSQPISCQTPRPTNLNVFISGTTFAPCDRTQSLDFPAPTCFPSRPSMEAAHWKAEEHAIYYEPGFYCPRDWTTATVMTSAAPEKIFWLNAEEPGWGPLGLQESVRQTICCPENWTLGGAAGCYSHISTSTSGTYCAVSPTGTQATQQALTNAAEVQATAVYYSTTWVYTTPAVVLVGGHIPTATSSATNEPLQSAESKLNGLSLAFKVSIGVIVPLVVIGGLIAGILLLMHRRKQRSGSAVVSEQELAKNDVRGEVGSFEMPPPAYTKQ